MSATAPSSAAGVSFPAGNGDRGFSPENSSGEFRYWRPDDRTAPSADGRRLSGRSELGGIDTGIVPFPLKFNDNLIEISRCSWYTIPTNTGR